MPYLQDHTRFAEDLIERFLASGRVAEVYEASAPSGEHLALEVMRRRPPALAEDS